MTTPDLPDGYSIRQMSGPEFMPLWKQHRTAIFRQPSYNFGGNPASLSKRISERVRLAAGLFHGADFVGWSMGHQIDASSFEMYNSAVFESHRNRGLYRALVEFMVARAQAEGFEVILSRHHPSNAAVLIPKLKAGFAIVGLRVDPAYGTLVELARYTNDVRRQALEVRVGAVVETPNLAALRK